MALKKPSEYFKKDVPSVDNSVREAAKSSELNTFSDAFDAFKNNLSKIEVLSDFSETLDNYRVNIERVNHLSESIEDIKTEIQSLLKKEDLDHVMMSQLLVVEQTIRDLQSKVKGINEKNLTEIRLDVSGLTQSVNEFLEIEAPKYKKLIVDSELRTNARYEELEENVNQTLEGIGEFVNNKYQELTETLQGINEKSLAGILEDFKALENNLQKIQEEDIPKYKGFIVETERNTELKLNEFDEKLSTSLESFEEELDLTVSSVLEKIKSVETNKEELVSEVTEKINDVKNLSKKVSEELKNNEIYKKELKEKVADLEVNIIRNESHIRVQNKNLQAIQEEVKETLSKINLEEFEEKSYKLGQKIKYLEEVFEKFSEKEILTENLLSEPSSAKNEDPLTPLDQKFVTLDQLQEHYRLFINRIQQQLATLGGGGETQLKYLDDIVGIATNPEAYDGKFLKYDHSIKKFEFVTVTQGGGGNVAIAITDTAPSNPQEGNLWYDKEIGRTFLYYTDDDGSQWVDANPAGSSGNSGGGESYWVQSNAGIYTTGNISIGTTIVGTGSTALWVEGDARITGILSVGQGTVTIDGINNIISIGSNVSIAENGSANYSGIVTASSFSNSHTTYGSATSSTTTLSSVGIHSELPVATYRSVEYFIQATTGSRYQALKLLSIHDGSTVYNTKYGDIFTNESIASFNVDISGGNIRLVATATTTANVTYIINYTANRI